MDDAAEWMDTVVVGSGFGGSVAAYRLAEAGRSVLVLERGRPYPPWSFPRSPAAMARNFWAPKDGLYGLFDIWSFRGLEGVVSSGLGGGSLIYANVLLRKDERWFVHESPLPGGGYEHWPISRTDLDPHYERVEQMLGATPYPFSDTPKTEAFHASAQRLGLDVQRPPLAVTFADETGAPVVGAPIPEPEYGNIHGHPRRTCRLCGECDVGCNDGAKNTLDHTYLSAARHHGAEIRTGCEVRGVSPLDGGGYEVRYLVHPVDAHPGEASSPAGQRTWQRIRCRRLVLAAGTFGTSHLLLSNRVGLPGLSGALGTRFSGNGDLLGLLVGARESMQATTGTVITSAIRGADDLDATSTERSGPGRGFYLEDAGYPAFVDWLTEASQVHGSTRRAVVFALQRLHAVVGRSPHSRISQQISTLLGEAELSDTSLPLLGMGRDIPGRPDAAP